MPRGSHLTDFEKGQICALESTGKSHRQIAKELKRSHAVIDNYLRDKEGYGSKKRKGRPGKLSAKAKRSLVRHLSNTGDTARKAASALGLWVHKKTVLRAIHKAETLKYSKPLSKPPLRQIHKTARLNFAQRWMDWGL